MNSKELIKKIDTGRLGNGSVSYNDMCLILNKEETLEHLQYIERLELALEKAIEKCMKFDKCPPITCIELYNDNDNDNVCKECWKKYFMKEVLDND